MLERFASNQFSGRVKRDYHRPSRQTESLPEADRPRPPLRPSVSVPRSAFRRHPKRPVRTSLPGVVDSSVMRETGSFEKGCLVSMATPWFGATGRGDTYHRATECPHLVERALARRRPSWASSLRPLSTRKPRFVVACDFFSANPDGAVVAIVGGWAEGVHHLRAAAPDRQAKVRRRRVVSSASRSTSSAAVVARASAADCPDVSAVQSRSPESPSF